jgi:hypothetical protein
VASVQPLQLLLLLSLPPYVGGWHLGSFAWGKLQDRLHWVAPTEYLQPPAAAPYLLAESTGVGWRSGMGAGVCKTCAAAAGAALPAHVPAAVPAAAATWYS